MFTGVGVHACRDTWVEVRGSSQGSVLAFCLVWDLVSVSFATVHTTLPGPHVFRNSLVSPFILPRKQWDYWSALSCQTLHEFWGVELRSSSLLGMCFTHGATLLASELFFFLNNIVSGVVPLCRFHCAQPSPGSLTNASFPCYLNPGNAVNILRVPEASVLGPSINTGLHGHAGLCTSGLTLARNVCTSSCTLSVNFALLRTTSTSQVCVNSC